MEKKVLLLNSTYEPLKILTWQKAIMLYFGEKASIIESYSDFDLGTQKFTMPCPAVIVLRKYAKINNKKVTFSRSNIFSRDNYSCQYCLEAPGSNKLTFDHVLPRSRGGKTEWTNIVACCYPCNFKKADRTPQEAAMKLAKVPTHPATFSELSRAFKTSTSPAEWDAYLLTNP